MYNTCNICCEKILGCDKLEIILASASERRHELLKRLFEEFTIKVSDFDESKVSFNGDFGKYVEELSMGKALDVSNKVTKDSLIIAADTIVAFQGKVLLKPKDENDAYNMLRELSGNIHEVYSGITVLNSKTKDLQCDYVKTEIKFSNLTDEEIINYIKTKEPMDKAGSYGIQGLGGVFVEEIKGCYYNVVGLPLNKLKHMINTLKK